MTPVLIGQNNKPIEQVALEYFMDELYGDSLFVGECNGSVGFHPDYCIKLYTDSAAFKLSMRWYLSGKYRYLGQEDKALEVYGNKKLRKLEHLEKFDFDLSEYPIIEEYPYKTAPEYFVGGATLQKGKNYISYDLHFNCYLVRFSTKVLYEGIWYIKLWIKQGYASDGTHVYFEIENGKVIFTHKRQACDDHG
jgi:hypothetical protein